MEGENPTRRYKWFRPRQAAVGYGTMTGAQNNNDVVLYNNSTATQLLVVRDILWWMTNNDRALLLQIVQGKIGTLASDGLPMVRSQGKPPGQIFTYDDPNLITGEQIVSLNATTGWNHDFPIGILEPGWSAKLQASSSSPLSAYFMWEAITAEELDFLDW